MGSQILPTKEQALPGRDTAMQISNRHYVSGTALLPPFADHLEQIIFGMGCFWGAERKFWSLQGVYTTAAGYTAGQTKNPTYQEVCSGMTGHNEVVLVVFDSNIITLEQLLKLFWEAHNPTQGMQQGNDQGTQYRSGIYVFNKAQRNAAESSRASFQQDLAKVGFGQITTEITDATEFYYAEDYHQQYLAKNPNGYCGLGGTGVSCAIDE